MIMLDAIQLLGKALRTCADILKSPVKIQKDARARLIKALQDVCSKCDDGYSAVLSKLQPIRINLHDRAKLTRAIDAFTGDAKLRAQFKPEHLCTEVDMLLAQLRSNLDPLKYAVDVRELGTLQETLQKLGNYDAALNHVFYVFHGDLSRLADDLRDPKNSDFLSLQRRVTALREPFETELAATIEKIRHAKGSVHI